MATIDVRERPVALATPALAVPPAPAGKVRDPWLDNARLVAAVLIVVSHCLLEVVGRSGLAEAAWAGTWAFRLPVYVVVAGLFSGAEPLTSRRAAVLLRNVLFVYVLFDLIQTVQLALNGRTAVYDPFLPEFGLWFLLSLFCWRVALPVLAHVRGLLWWSFAVAAGAGFLSSVGPAFGVSRTLALFPWFVLGWKLQDADLRARLGRPAVRAGAVLAALVVGGALAALALVADVGLGEYVMKVGYRGDLVEQVGHAALRLGLLGLGVVGALAVLSLIPRRRIPYLTVLGAGSMYIYLLHLLVVAQLIDLGYFETVDTRAELALMVLGAVAGALALASPPVRKLARPWVQPRSLPSVRALVPRSWAAGRVG